jgi:hypothetical protein
MSKNSQHETSNDFPKLGINMADLIADVERLITLAEEEKADMGAVNWGDIGVADIEYRYSMIYPHEGPRSVVIVEEASPDCALAQWLNERLDKQVFPKTHIECEW